MFKGRGRRRPGDWIKNVAVAITGVFVILLLIELSFRAYLYFYPQRIAKIFPEDDPAIVGITLIASDERTYIKGDKILDRSIQQTQQYFINNPYVLYKNCPNYRTKFTVNPSYFPYLSQNGNFRINALGIRGEEVSPQKSPDVFRVIAVGGSTAFGLFSSSDATVWSNRLQEKLNVCGAFPGRVEVLNAGTIGYIAEQELLYLQTELLDYSPDLVVAFNGYNDYLVRVAATNGCTQAMAGDHFTFIYQDLVIAMEEFAADRDREVSSQISQLLVDIITRSYLGKYFYQRLKSSGKTQAIPAVSADSTAPAFSKEICSEGLDHSYKRNLKKIARLTNSRNIPLLIAVQPHLMLKSNRSPEEEEIIQGQFAWAPSYGKLAEEIYPLLADAAKAVASEEEGTHYLDLTRAFNGKPELMFTDDVHLNDLGHEMIAQAMANYICRHIPLLPK